MSARQAAFAGGLALLSTALAYLVLTAGRVPALWYVPLTHRWTFRLAPGEVGIDWYFRGAASLAAGALAFALGRAVAQRAAWTTRAGTLRVVLGLAFAAVAWAALFMVFSLATTPRGRAANHAAPGHQH